MGEGASVVRPGAGGDGGFGFFPADDRQRLRVRRFLIASGTSLLVCLVLFVCSYFGVLPLQAAVWLLRGLVFEALSLVGVAAYQTQYRRFGASRWPASAISVQETDEASPAANAF